MQRLYCSAVAAAVTIFAAHGPAGADDNPAPSESQGQLDGLPADLTNELGRLLERDWKDRPQWASMAVSILKQDSMGSGSGWFLPSQKRYGWNWLANRYSSQAEDGLLSREELGELSDDDFKRLDLNRDDTLSAEDFDWTGGNPAMEDDSPAGDIFFRLDEDSNGRVTKEELNRFFDRSAGGFDFLTLEDIRTGFGFNPEPKQRQSGPPRSQRPRRDFRWVMLERLLNRELGLFTEGPNLDDDAPELDLPLVARSSDGSKLELTDRMIRLAEFRGQKPVVLIFGSFT